VPKDEDIYSHRVAVVKIEGSQPIGYQGREVHSIKDKGIVVISKSDPKLRVLYPWNAVCWYIFHGKDESRNML
jgi:hypothetical protein